MTAQETIQANHAEIMRLLSKIEGMASNVNPDSKSWGDAAELGLIVMMLKEAARED